LLTVGVSHHERLAVWQRITRGDAVGVSKPMWLASHLVDESYLKLLPGGRTEIIAEGSLNLRASLEEWRIAGRAVELMQPTGPVTLGDLVRDDKLLWIYCCACGRERSVNPATVPLPLKTPVPEVSKHIKCSACGSRKINTKPQLYSIGSKR